MTATEPSRGPLVGVYGGTFDPVHLGHLRTALELREDAGLAEVRFVPCREPPHRDTPGAPVTVRQRMLAAALDRAPGFVLDERELDRAGPSYTVDTMESLRESLPDATLCLILGMDAFLGLERWHRWRDLLELANLIVAHRPGWSPEPGSVADRLEGRRVAAPSELAGVTGRLWLHAVTALDISSTDVRARVARGADVRFLVTDAVRDILLETGCYRGAHAAA